MERVTLTENELLEALQSALGGTEDAEGTFTAPEIKALTGRSEHWLRPRLRALVAAGTLEPAKVQRTNPWGVTAHVMGFRLRRAA